MVKWLLLGVLVLTILAVMAAFVVISQIDSVARTAIEKGGTQALGVPTSLEDVRVGLLSGTVSMNMLQIGNPDGFEAPYFVRIGAAKMAVRVETLTQELIELPELAISRIDMTLEKRSGKANYEVILENLRQFQSRRRGVKKSEKKGEGRKYVIRKISLRDISVQADLLPVGGALTRIPIKIEAIELENIGSDSDREVLISELVGLLTHAVLTGLVQKAGNLIPPDMLRELSDGLRSVEGLAGVSIKVIGDVTKQVGQITKGVSKIAETITGNVGDLGKNVGEVEGMVRKGIDGLLNMDRQDDPE